MSEYEEVNNTPNEEVVNEALAEAEAKRKETIAKLESLDWGFRYVVIEDGVNQGFLDHVEKSLTKKQDSLRKAREVVQEFLETVDGDSELSQELIAMFTDLEDPLNLDLDVTEEATVEARFIVYYSRKPWERAGELDSSDLSVSIEGNYGFDIDDYSVDSVEVY